MTLTKNVDVTRPITATRHLATSFRFLTRQAISLR